MYHTGMGPSHVSNFLAALEIPSQEYAQQAVGQQ